MTYSWSGTLRPTDRPDIMVGEISDSIGSYSIAITGTRDGGGHVWTEGVCADGAAILRDGVMMPISAILDALNDPGSLTLAGVPEPCPDWLLLPWEAKAE